MNLIINGATRRETIGNVQYLVAPVVAAIAGKLNEPVSADELGAYFMAWNGTPFVMGHPTDAEGNHVSANDPQLLSQIQLGNLFNVEMDGDKLKGEVWVNLAWAEAIARGREVVNRLEKGEPLEVSTAFFRDFEDGEARNLRPDHLAALLDVRGACSWQDGCGAPRVNCNEGEKPMDVNILARARRPTYDGTETEPPWSDVDLTWGAFRDAFYQHTATDRPDEPPELVQDAPQDMRDWIAARTLLGDPSAETEADLIALPVVNPRTNRLNAGGLRGAISRVAQSDWPQETIDSAQAVGRELLELEFSPEGEQSVNFLRRIADGVNKLLKFSQNQQERKMEELIKAILDSGRMDLTEEELGAMSERHLKAIMQLLEPAQEQEPAPEPAEAEAEPAPAAEANEPEANEPEPTPAANCEALATFMQGLEQRGGANGLFSFLDGLRANEQEKRNEIISALVANEQCTIEQPDLAVMNMKTLQALHRSFLPVDYSGQGDPEPEQVEYELHVNRRVPAREG